MAALGRFMTGSLVSLPEAAIVGAASGAFASAEVPSLAPVESSRIFIRLV
jgi:hypothetical protein